jgi:hypothetical protein
LERIVPLSAAAGPGAAVHHVAFTPEGRHLVTVNGNGTLCVLWLAPGGAEKGGK